MRHRSEPDNRAKFRRDSATDILTNDPDATPIELEDLQYLKANITTRRELNAWEATNIQNGLDSARRSRTLKASLLTVSGILKVHSLMFNKTWTWAGKFRIKSVHFGPHEGAAYGQIASQCASLCADVETWEEFHVYEWPEISARLHHRLVLIHPFANGNGRHSRLMADLLMSQKGQPIPTWGRGGDLISAGEKRREYIESLREADRGDMTRLIQFMYGADARDDGSADASPDSNTPEDVSSDAAGTSPVAGSDSSTQ